MDNGTNYVTPKSGKSGKSGSSGEPAEDILEKGAEAYEQAEESAKDIYHKTTRKATETYDKARKYCDQNPGRTVVIVLGIGISLGYLLGSMSHKEHNNYEPLVKALSDFCSDFMS